MKATIDQLFDSLQEYERKQFAIAMMLTTLTDAGAREAIEMYMDTLDSPTFKVVRIDETTH